MTVEVGLVLQADVDRHLGQLGQGEPLLIEVGADFQNVLLVQIGDDVDRIELHDFRQGRLLAHRADDIAGIDQMLAHLAVKRCPDLGIAEVQLRDGDACLGARELGLRQLALENPVVDLDLRGGFLGDQRLVTGDFGAGIDQRRFRRRHLRLRLDQLCLVLVLLDREQQVALLDQRAIGKMDRVEIALDAGDQLDRIDRRGIAGQFDIIGDRLGPGLDDRHLRRVGQALRSG